MTRNGKDLSWYIVGTIMKLFWEYIFDSPHFLFCPLLLIKEHLDMAVQVVELIHDYKHVVFYF